MTNQSCDVLVVGGGPAGIAAALAAAACGARTVLLERESMLGGNVSQAFVHTICGLYLPSAQHEAVHAHAGLPQAFAKALAARGGAGEIGWAGSAGFLAIDPLVFAALGADSCKRAGVQVRCDADVVEVRASERWHAALAGGPAIGAGAIIDCSGDATAAALAGLRVEQSPGEELQHASYIFRVDGVDAASLTPMERARTATAVAHAARHGRLPGHAASIAIRCAVATPSAFVTINLPKPEASAFDPLDPCAVDAMNGAARATARTLLRFLVAERAPFARARMGQEPARIGIRETRRVVGVERVEVDDVLSGRRRHDEACISTWPVELWQRSDRLTFRAGAGPCSIPMGALIAADAHRLAMAGRCASASHEASGAIRVIATSMAMGEAAAVASALAVQRDVALAGVGAGEVRDVVASGRTCQALR
ncbi:MAG TPA: FAD-dependent oxidoreductase [Candidatus Binatia bacterium]|nr:FAD-dependent oxidoreductase [Candidatus Binatia bacterium]